MIRWRQHAKARLQQSWYGRDPTIVAVPLTLAAIELLTQQAQLRFLLFPPLAALAYLLFTRPVGPHATWRGAVVAPSVGAGIGTVGTLAFQPGFLGVLVIAFLTMISMRFLRVTTPPVLAVALLPLVRDRRVRLPRLDIARRVVAIRPVQRGATPTVYCRPIR